MANKTKAPTPFQMMKSGMKSMGKKVMKGVRKGAQKMANPLVREFMMQDEQNKKWKMEGEERNRSYSGLPSNVKFRK